jgi:hypothetical protein
MKQVLSTVMVAVVAAAAAVVSTSVAFGASRAQAARSHVAIKEHGNAHPATGLVFLGRFRLELDGAAFDSGSTSIRPNAGNPKTVDGQQQLPVAGDDNLTGKKGSLTIHFRGVSIPVDTSASGDAYYAEYGTWKITFGSGIYKGWKGAGRWANAGTPSTNNLEWDGYVTR